MAPTAAQIERQTSEILKYLFDDDDDDIKPRELDGIETDGPTVVWQLERKLKLQKRRDYMIGTQVYTKMVHPPLDPRRASAELGAVEAVFTNGVKKLCQSQVSQRAEVAPEMQLIVAAVALGRFITKSSPELKNKVQSAVGVILSRSGGWVAQQGGWDKVTSN
eukprot:superscaffoldBa00000546_g5554